MFPCLVDSPSWAAKCYRAWGPHGVGQGPWDGCCGGWRGLGAREEHCKIQLGQPLGLAGTWVPFGKAKSSNTQGVEQKLFSWGRRSQRYEERLPHTESEHFKEKWNSFNILRAVRMGKWAVRLLIEVKQHKSTYLSIVSFDHNILKCPDTQTQGLFVLNISCPSEKPRTLPLPAAD